MQNNVEEKIREVAERVAGDLGLEVVEVELRGGGPARMLRITIDREAVAGGAAEPAAQVAGVTHEDCANLSREVSTILDVEDVVPGASYTLEVSSPGLDRKLVKPRDWERAVGQRVKLVTHAAVENQKAFTGRLERFSDGRLLLELKTTQKKSKVGNAPSHKVEIDLANVDRANLVPEF